MTKYVLRAAGVAGLALALAATAAAAPGLKLDKRDIAAKQCDAAGAHAKQLVDVHYRLLNDADSGFAGNFWANDTIDRQVRIWQEGDGSYCVQVADHGKFVTFAGASPGNTGTVTAGVTGNIEGGYITNNVMGMFTTANRPAHGDLGTFDLGCDQTGNCPGSAPSWKDYFAPLASANEFAQWGWIYHAGKNGTWLNQDDVAAADSGDITSS